MEKLYLSTALPYVNSPPHAGFALEIIQADVIARYHRFLGEGVFFLTGTDENALKNVRAAKEAGISVKEFVDKNTQKFYQLKDILNLSLDDFIRTTDKRHINGAQKLWRACRRDIYKKKYKGLYCVGCEEFYKESELINEFCPEHKTKPELVEEENYFFKLSKYQDRLKKIIEKNEVKIIPEARKNEALSFINSGLQDFCISRSAERAYGWGIDVPDDPTQKIWVWLEALSNYINALGYAENSKRFREWWQENKNKLHIIGKGILRFHAIYWIAFLLSAKISLPKTIFVHGYLTVGGQKMSKSLGNVIDPFELVKKYGVDAVRYFLLREIPATEDGDFTYEKFEERYNADLANGLGNLVARIVTLAYSFPKQFRASQGKETQVEIKQEWQKYHQAINQFGFSGALASCWNLISFGDKYIDKEKLWELPKKNEEKFQEITSELLTLLGIIGWMLRPFLPQTSEKIFEQLGIDPDSKTSWQFKVEKGKPLFPRI